MRPVGRGPCRQVECLWTRAQGDLSMLHLRAVRRTGIFYPVSPLKHGSARSWGLVSGVAAFSSDVLAAFGRTDAVRRFGMGDNEARRHSARVPRPCYTPNFGKITSGACCRHTRLCNVARESRSRADKRGTSYIWSYNFEKGGTQCPDRVIRAALPGGYKVFQDLLF